MTITIHRGTHQIGGCITEIKTDKTRILIDMGAQLPDINKPETPDTIEVPGVTFGEASCGGVFFTHSHGDHIGLIDRVLPGIPLFMGETTKDIYQSYCRRINNTGITAVQSALVFHPAQPVKIGDIFITPFMIDHSAFDAYMFLIESDGKKVLHTGDFRFHGFRGSKTLKMLERYVGQVDILICEGTMLSRSTNDVMSERELQNHAREIMREYKHVFVLCASTNIDRIAAFYNAIPDKRPMICDDYQKELLDIVRSRHAVNTSLYDFKHVYTYGNNLEGLISERGFCMLVRANEQSRMLIERYPEDSIIIYSMWNGYLDNRAFNKHQSDFLAPYAYKALHTSGHATTSDLENLYRAVNPRKGLVPIHCDSPEAFSMILPNTKIIILKDGEKFKI